MIKIIFYLFLTLLWIFLLLHWICLNFIMQSSYFNLSLIIDRMFLVLTYKVWLWVNDRRSNRDIKLIQINVILYTNHLRGLDIYFYNIRLRTCNCILNLRCWLLSFLLDSVKVQQFSSTKLMDFLSSGLLLTSVYLQECLSIY